MNKTTDGRVHGRPALFLDRDGVINEDVGYAHQREEIRFLAGIFELVAAANTAGMPVVVVTNQAGIARGLYEEKDFHALMDWMKQCFREQGAHLDAVYFCPHHPVHGKGRYKAMCSCRKPAPGMLLQAACELDINLKASIMLGDTVHDMEAAIAADVGTPILLELPGTSRKDTANRLPTQVRRITSLTDVLNFFPSRCRDQVGRPTVSAIMGQRQFYKSDTAANEHCTTKVIAEAKYF